VLAGSRLGNDARLPHASSEQDLAEDIVHLVRAGVVQLLALEIDLCSREMGGKALGEVEWAWASDIMLEEALHLSAKAWVRLGLRISALQIEHERHQGLGHEAAAK